MVVIYTQKFMEELRNIADFIALDSQDKADEFSAKLKAEINKIYPMPYRFKMNEKLNREDTRNLIFKGYTIVFRIGKSEIKILAIFKNNKHKYSNT